MRVDAEKSAESDEKSDEKSAEKPKPASKVDAREVLPKVRKAHKDSPAKVAVRLGVLLFAFSALQGCDDKASEAPASKEAKPSKEAPPAEPEEEKPEEKPEEKKPASKEAPSK